MFAVCWTYLNRRAVLARVDSPDDVEWPPHPDRLFQALVAAWGERGEDPTEAGALRWLERQPPPAVLVPAPAKVSTPLAPTTYVPQNDTRGADRRGRYSERGVELLPAFRNRKPRKFPSILIEDEAVGLLWPDAEPADHLGALQTLVQNLTSVGHSSSIVRAWIEPHPPPPRWIPAEGTAAPQVHLRVPEPGRLDELVRAFAGGGAGWQRPSPSAWAGYRELGEVESPTGVLCGPQIVLRRVSGSPIPLLATLALTRAVRAALVRRSDGPARVLLSGHTEDGGDLRSEHVAYLPLPFVGAPRADGHVMGVLVAIPQSCGGWEVDSIMSAFERALDPETEALEIELPDGQRRGFVVEDRAAPPRALRGGTWSNPSREWATVTPIVLDKHPPRRHPHPDQFVARVIGDSCVAQGLPRPAEVRTSGVSVQDGVPHAAAFPGLPSHAGQPRRAVHALMRFDAAICGPLALGAGRYRGYGLCKPLDDGIER